VTEPIDSPPAYIPGMRLLLALSLVVASSACRSVAAHPVETNAAPPSFVKTTAELRATRMVEVNPVLPKAQAMKTLVDALEEHYVVDVQDPRAGFVMTAWQSSAMRDGVPDLRYRTRITARFQGDDWHRLQLRGEANWARGDEWDIGYDSAQLDTVASDLRARFGKKP
jgi:hypothetical protein